MSLALTLNNALSSLRVNQRALTVLSQNIANANNPEYSRKVIEQESQTLVGEGAGVAITDVSRRVDTYLQDAMQRQTSTLGKTNALNEYASRLQVLLGRPGAADSVDGYVTDFFNSLQSLANEPERSSFKLNAVNSGVALARRVSDLVDDVQQLRTQADQDIGVSVSDVNRQIRALYDLNTAIANAHTMRRSTAELLDKRDTLVRGISEHLDTNAYFRADGTVRLYTAGGGVLVDENYSELDYTTVNSPESFQNNSSLGALNLYRINPNGSRAQTPTVLVTSGVSSEITSTLTTGKIRAYIDIRDEKMPDLIDQIDMLASRIRDQVNAIHNRGSSYPGATTLTGTRAVAGGDYSLWSGKVRIGLVDTNGNPITSPYTNEESGYRPLTIDLANLDSGTGNGAGQPSIATIIKEINQHFGVPQNKLSLGNLNNIQLSSLNVDLPDSTFNFDFDLENISDGSSSFFVTSVAVEDDGGNPMTPVTDTIPSVALSATNTFATTLDSAEVTVTTAGVHEIAEGDVIYLPEPGVAVNGIPSASLGGYFTVTEVSSATSFKISANAVATSTGTQNVSSLEALPEYHFIAAGEKQRTGAQGNFRVDLSGNFNSDYYDVTANIGVIDADGNISTSSVTYRVQNNSQALYGTRYGATSEVGSAVLTRPREATGAYATAKLVDADGNELQRTNGDYFSDQEGYLKLETASGDYFFVIDSLDSVEQGRPNEPIALAGSSRGFSHFFELNNFFNSNIPTNEGDTVAGSANNLAVSSRIAANSGLFATGGIVQSNRPADLTKPPLYTYVRSVGDNSIAHDLAGLASQLISYDSAGGLSYSNQTLNGYAGEIIGFASADANNAESSNKSARVILDGFRERSTALSGVNLDEELANTVIYQNSYAASARIITVVDELFTTLLQSF